MIICSWDVGITHLAYCIMEYKETDEKIKFPIYGWRNINLINKEPLICEQQMKKGNKICGKKAKYVIMEGETEIGYCGSHVKNCEKDNNEDIFYENNSKKIKCISLCTNENVCNKKAAYYKYDKSKKISYCKMHKKKYEIENDDIFCKNIPKDKSLKCIYGKCNKNATYYSKTDKNDSYCTVHKNITLVERKNKNIVKLVKNLKCNKISMNDVKLELVKRLDQYPELLQVDKVVIENQPTLINPKMKGIASTLYSYFLIRGIVDKDKTNSKITDVVFMSPSNKLKVDKDNTLIVLSRAESHETKYKLTKNLGIQYCKQLIINDIPNLNLLNSHKKQDDLADAMLQGAYFLKIKPNIITSL